MNSCAEGENDEMGIPNSRDRSRLNYLIFISVQQLYYQLQAFLYDCFPVIMNFVEFRLLKAELLLRQSSSSGVYLDWSVRKVCVCGLLGKKWLAQSRRALNINKFLKAEVFCNCIQFCLIFSFFNNHFLLFILASVAANHKTTTELQRVEQN